MSKGKRYDDSKSGKLNIKKVVAVIIVLIVIIMFIAIIVKVTKSSDKKTSKRVVPLNYFSVYENGKWGVINGSGETVINPEYDEMIIIPNKEKDVFVVTYDVNYDDGTYKTKAVNSKNQELFTDYESVEPISNSDKQNSLFYYENCLKVSKDGKYGLIDLSGKSLVDCVYDSIKPVQNLKNSLITSKDGKVGLISSTGATIINNEYKNVKALTDSYEDGYIVENEDNKYGVIGTDKKIHVPVEYDEIENVYSNDVFVVKNNKKLYIYDATNNNTEPVELNTDDVKSINNNNIIAKQKEQYGLISTAGHTTLEAKYQDLTYIFSNYYIAELNGKYGIIDDSGETKVDFKYDKLSYRKEADIIEGSTTQEISSDLIDRNFQVKLSGIISEMNIDDGYMKVRINDEYKYYNFKFEEKKYKDLFPNNTLYLDKKDGKYGYINSDGVVVVNYIYDDATEQNKYGFASVKKDGKWGAIDSEGKLIVEPKLDLSNNPIINFIGTWHLAEDLNANYYTK